MSIKVLFALWDKFFFEEGSPLAVALYRIGYGVLLLLWILLLTPEMNIWFGKFAIVSSQTVRDFQTETLFNLLFAARDNDRYLLGLFVVFFCSALCLTIGYKTRLASILSWICICSIYHRDPLLFNSGDTYLRVSGFWMLFAPAGAALSVDHYLAKKAGIVNDEDFAYKPVSRWTLRVMQLQLAIVYCHTFFAKAPGSVWVNGTAVYWSSRIEDLVRYPLPFVFDNLWTIGFLTYATLVLEGALWTLIWFKEFRYWILLLAIAFHITIDYHMNIPLFEWTMIVSYTLFIYDDDARKWLISLRKVGRRKVESH